MNPNIVGTNRDVVHQVEAILGDSAENVADLTQLLPSDEGYPHEITTVEQLAELQARYYAAEEVISALDQLTGEVARTLLDPVFEEMRRSVEAGHVITLQNLNTAYLAVGDAFTSRDADFNSRAKRVDKYIRPVFKRFGDLDRLPPILVCIINGNTVVLDGKARLLLARQTNRIPFIRAYCFNA